MSQRAVLRSTAAGFIAVIGSLVVTLQPRAEAAERPKVSIGDVSVGVDAHGEATPELSRALRAALNSELSHVPNLSNIKRPLVVSATLTRLSSERGSAQSKASATISLALSRADDRVLFAELRGRASVEEASGNLASLRRTAVEEAVRGAMARLPEAVKRAP